MSRMLLDLEFGKKDYKKEVVTSIIENLFDCENMQSPHADDEKCSDMFRTTVFEDDVNGGNELNKEEMIKARRTEMEFFKKMGVYRKVPRAEIKKQWGQDHQH